MITLRMAVCMTVLLLSGCAARKYQAAPISPPETAVRIETRNLQDSGLREFLTNNLGRDFDTWPPKTWDPSMLTLAGLYFHADVAVARAGLTVAEAGVVTAGARPNPSLSVGPGVSNSPEGPWLFSINPNIPIETAGKRGIRIETAERLTDVARLQLAEAAWGVRMRLRASLLDLLISRQNLDLLRSEEQVRIEMVRLLQQRFDVGAIPRPILDAVQIDLTNTRVAIRAEESVLAQARPALASAIGVPVSALENIDVVWPEFQQPPKGSTFSAEEIQRVAVLNRLDIRRLLADYAASEAALRTEIAKQYPDVQLGPGYNYEEAHHFFTVGLSLTLPVFNRNQGPIAEAEARRKQAGERFLALQAQAIGESEKALGAYQVTLNEMDEATTALIMQQGQERLARQAFDQGDIDRLTLTGTTLQTAIAGRAQLTALSHAQSFLGALESAVQKPLEPAWLIPGLPSSDHPEIDLVKEPPK